MNVLRSFLVLLAATLAFASPREAPPTPLAPGAKAPNFTLADIQRRPRGLDDFKSKNAYVIAFLDTECPVSNLYVPTLIEMHKQYAKRGVQFLAINSSAHDSFVAVAAHALERDIPFPVLKDFEQKTATAFGVARCPEVVLLDGERIIRYRGRLDDQYTVGQRRDKPTRHDLQLALDEVLAGKAVSVPVTEPSGCVIERVKSPRVAGEVTYAKHVAPIIQNRCQECHRPGEVAPFPLMSYDDAKKRAGRIREAVLEERMPPWHADPRHGRFDNDRRLTSEERDTLLAWVESGAAKGEERDLPPPVKYVEGWKIGVPDKIYTMSEEFKVPATGVVDYKRFRVDPGFTEDMWVQAAECRPGNRAVVHHILVYIMAPGLIEPYDFDGTAHTLAGWAPGDMPTIYSPGIAKKIPKGSKLMFEVHYTPNGVAQSDRSSVGVIFAKDPPKLVAETNVLANMKLRVPPGAANHKGEMTYVFPHNALVLGFMPHMHLRGTSARYDVIYPDGKTDTLLSVPSYDFNWQSAYRFKEPLRIPKGTKLIWSARWDNSADNPRNPDPKVEVRWGLQTWEEMQNGWMEVVWLKTQK